MTVSYKHTDKNARTDTGSGNEPMAENERRKTEKNSRDESNFTYNFQPDSLAQTAHHCQVPELKGKK